MIVNSYTRLCLVLPTIFSMPHHPAMNSGRQLRQRGAGARPVAGLCQQAHQDPRKHPRYPPTAPFGAAYRADRRGPAHAALGRTDPRSVRRLHERPEPGAQGSARPVAPVQQLRLRAQPWWDVQPLVAQGRLVQVLHEYSQGADIWAVYPTRLADSAKLRVCVEFLEARLKHLAV